MIVLVVDVLAEVPHRSRGVDLVFSCHQSLRAFDGCVPTEIHATDAATRSPSFDAVAQTLARAMGRRR